MRVARSDAVSVALGVSLVSMLACGSTSDIHPSTDASGDSGLSAEASLCLPFGGPGCGQGETCCLSGLVGACADRRACTSPLQFECSSSHGCEAGQVCCASIPRGLGASVVGTEAGKPVLIGVSAMSACAATCSLPSFVVCFSSSDCAGGATCEQLPEGDPVLVALGGETFGACSADAGALSSSEAGVLDGASPVSDVSATAD